MNFRRLLPLLGLLIALPAFAGPPTALTRYVSFDDVNGNGRLDCAEPVTIEAAYNASSAASAVSGILTAPTPATVALSYLPGSAVITPDHQVGCNGSVTDGFDPDHDPTWSANFTCDPAISVPAGTFFFSVTYKAIYVARAGLPGFTSSVLVTTTDGQNLSDTEPQTFPTATCSGPPTPLKITKTASGNAVPGSPLTYTLTASNASSTGVGGVQLVDTVPPNTTFSASLSSPGWACAPNAGAGSVCRLPMGNLLGNASASALFAVTVASPLAAGVSSISNTGCVSEGPSQVDDCASVSVPTAGTPMLSLAKSLASGNGSRARLSSTTSRFRTPAIRARAMSRSRNRSPPTRPSRRRRATPAGSACPPAPPALNAPSP